MLKLKEAGGGGLGRESWWEREEERLVIRWRVS